MPIPQMMLIILGVTLWVGAFSAYLICRKTNESRNITLLSIATSIVIIVGALLLG